VVRLTDEFAVFPREEDFVKQRFCPAFPLMTIDWVVVFANIGAPTTDFYRSAAGVEFRVLSN